MGRVPGTGLRVIDTCCCRGWGGGGTTAADLFPESRNAGRGTRTSFLKSGGGRRSLYGAEVIVWGSSLGRTPIFAHSAPPGPPLLAWEHPYQLSQAS